MSGCRGRTREAAGSLGHANTVLGAHTELPEERGEFIDAGDLDGDGVDDIVFGDMHALLSNP